MLDFVRSIDANHQWRTSIREGDVMQDGGPRHHSEGMPLWMACSAREKAFRILFTDWQNVAFPDFGEGCLKEKYVTVQFINTVITKDGSTSTTLPLQARSMTFKLNDQLLSSPESQIRVISGSIVKLPDTKLRAIEFDGLTIEGSYRDSSLFERPFVIPISGPMILKITHGYDGNQDFGAGLHTETASGVGYEFVGFANDFFPIAKYNQHTFSFQVTYRIAVTDQLDLVRIPQ